MMYVAAHKPTLKFKRQSRNIVRELWQRFFEAINRLRCEVFICIKPQYPSSVNRQIVQSPVKLLGVKSRPFMEHSSRAHLDGHLVGSVARLRLYDKNLLRLKRLQSFQTPPHM